MFYALSYKMICILNNMDASLYLKKIYRGLRVFFRTTFAVLLVFMGTKPNYSHLRAFGCLAFATNPRTNKDKFAPKGITCVFLGYPPNKRGYKLLSLMNKQVFVARDVRFLENIFPCNKHSEKRYVHPIPADLPQKSFETLVHGSKAKDNTVIDDLEGSEDSEGEHESDTAEDEVDEAETGEIKEITIKRGPFGNNNNKKIIHTVKSRKWLLCVLLQPQQLSVLLLPGKFLIFP